MKCSIFILNLISALLGENDFLHMGNTLKYVHN
jgi:hypothetical protein